jgi:hypothetical protein
MEDSYGTGTTGGSGERRAAHIRASHQDLQQGGVEVSLWRNSGEKGDMYNTTIRNSYKDENSGEWKETSSFSPTDLAVVAQLKRSPSGDFFPPSPLRLSLYLASCAGTPRLP